MAEFDEYASGYSAGMEHPLKQLVGRDADDFLVVKARWLVGHLTRHRPRSAATRSLRLLDYGCGLGAFLSALRRLGFDGVLTGCDASAQMLEEAVKGWTGGSMPTLRVARDGRAPFADESFDVVVLSSVLHHLRPDERNDLLGDTLRLLPDGGVVVVFEHNPLNPVTQWVVKHTPIDRNAQLLRAGEVRHRLEVLGAPSSTTRFLLFFPPRLKRLSRVEHWLSWIPLGGQYVVVGEKGAGLTGKGK